MSDLTGQSDYERFLAKWDKILKSGTGDDQLSWRYLNEYAHLMLPREDPAMKAVKRFERAVFELTMIEKKAIIMRGDHGDKTSFRNRMYNRQAEKENRGQRELRDVIEGQFRWLKEMKLQMIKP